MAVPTLSNHGHRALRLGLLGLAWLLIAASSATATAAEELRGLWVDAFHRGFRNPAEAEQLVRDAREAGLNALFVQVRRRGDAFHESSFEPRAAEIAPDFDPLRHLLTLAHDTHSGPRLEVHAWVVAFNIWNSTNTRPESPDHPFLKHPQWLTRSVSGATWDGANYAFDPGHPEVQEYTFQVLMDLVRQYDLDGLHLDYIRYAGREWGYHPEAIRRFNRYQARDGIPSASDPDWLQFRRDQVTGLVRKLYLTCLEEKPGLRVSAATIAFAPGITNRVQWPTSAAYSEVLQDWRAWMEEGILDWNIPMLYFRQRENGSALADWNVFVKDHQYRRRAAIGLAWYLNKPSQVISQIRAARRPSPNGHEAIGTVAYAYASPSSGQHDPGTFAVLRAPSRVDPHPIPVFAGPADVPATPWKRARDTGHIKGFVRDANSEKGLDGAMLRIESNEPRTFRTDATGFFGQVDLLPGNYRLHVTAPGMESLTTDVSVRGGTVSHLDLPLAPTPP